MLTVQYLSTLDAVQNATHALLMALKAAGVDLPIREAFRRELATALDDASMAQAAEDLAASARQIADHLADQLKAAGLEPHNVGRWVRLNGDAAVLTEHANGLLSLMAHRAQTTREMVNGTATLAHLVIEDLPL